MDTIETTTLNRVDIQANGIIRNNKGRLIGRLVEDMPYSGEHVRGNAINKDFRRELKELINKYSLENRSDTNDFLLSDYLVLCLDNFGYIVKYRDQLKDTKSLN